MYQHRLSRRIGLFGSYGIKDLLVVAEKKLVILSGEVSDQKKEVWQMLTPPSYYISITFATVSETRVFCHNLMINGEL